MCDAFNALFTDPHTRPVTAEWVERYISRRIPVAPRVTGVEIEPPPAVPLPNMVQIEAA